MTKAYRNISFAAAGSFSEVLETGYGVTVRGTRTKELRNQMTLLEEPCERFMFVPERMNDCFAQVAESLWVLAGRNDIEWLRHYLPRAPQFSDDGRTWRAAYGPRIRSWHGETDQIEKVLDLLRTDPSSRRAVMGLFDLQLDFTSSLDIPCNNLLTWLIRDGTLHLSVVLRSNDAMWGFSGANAFEWSILHELMARWLDVGVGSATFVAASFHLYEDHWNRAARVVSKFRGLSPYDFDIPRLPIDIEWASLDDELRLWFELEELIRNDPQANITRLEELRSRFLRVSLQAIRLYWLDKQTDSGLTDDFFANELATLPECDLVAATYEFLSRARRPLLSKIAHPNIARYFAATTRAVPGDDDLSDAIKRLHVIKDKAYGGAWKKRGELISVLPNIARKVDRLEVYTTSGHDLVGETILDTAVDLFVYSAKYRLLLEEQEPGDLLPAAAPYPFTDHPETFDLIVDASDVSKTKGSADDLIGHIVATFESLWPLAEAKSSMKQRKKLSTELISISARLIGVLRENHPDQAVSLITSVAQVPQWKPTN